jgi:RHS repeat-associated protein
MGGKVLYRSKEGGVTKLTDYIGNFVYEGNVLKYVQTPEGRAVYDANTHLFKEEFFVKDHLENIRSVVDVYTYPIQQYLASYEIASANLEGLFFDNMDEVRDDKPGSIDPNDNQAGNLNGDDPDRRIGTSMLLKVMAGDKVELNVNSFYESYDENNLDAVPVEEMLESIIATLSGGTGGFEGSESHDTRLVTDVFSNGNYQQYNDMLSVQYDPARPRAYLNYVLFDEGMNIIPDASGAFQANGSGSWAPIGTATPMVIPANGYLAVYLSNGARLGCGTCNDVFFDQLVVRMTTGKLREESHYYPFGLPIGSMGSAAAGFTPNKDKYQSNEFNKDLGLNLMDFHNRQYDPQLGRFLSIDPMAAATAMMSPYVAMNNNPVSVTDPLGLIGEVMPTFNVQTPRVSFYMPFLVMSHYGNQAGDKSAAGQALDAAMAKASSDIQKSYLLMQSLGSGTFTAQGSSASPNNSGSAGAGTIYTATGPVIEVNGSKSEGKKGPGFFGKLWNAQKNIILGILTLGDRLVSTDRDDRSHDKDGGGTEHKGADGQSQEKRTVGHPDEKPVEVDAMSFMFGNGGSGGPTQFARWTEIGDNMLKSFMSIHDATSNLNDVMKENGLGQPTHGYEVKAMPGNGGVYGVYDEHSDTSGMASSLDSLMCTLRNK